ncbi:hypothetical protein NLG97_g5485 [Lecanicillium saksenae]|uniref:Uncharacterized protein n=1 Tax=Lecanicillium saksenae TaxID=468837 RepID=A0ACC1QSC1_9HYPO|nr:hypothetical protein NLG97_g5485 [Lecanicillium saksenae]
MMTKVFALVAFAALATATKDHGGACSVVTITGTATIPTTTKTSTSTEDNCSTRTVCIDKVNECGMWYGGCVPDCKPWPTFSKPACPTDTVITTTKTTSAPTTTSTPDNCSTRSVCADYVNSCGMWYGGCFPDCKPWPTFTPPPCPSTTTLITSVTATSK